ncbi:hypothetical protein [Sphingomonas sp.]|uniref:hypothetical protein n=1 Tax=Sphingomonas sp. TaxID=28214 RepID=UPI001B2DD01D|nr:hypothetical protein [Sphingomonas sp.]MBO9714627.1 hypothetical protein [Sphingomonas sp.]
MSTHAFKRDNFGLATANTIYDAVLGGAAAQLDALTLAFSQSPAPQMPSSDAETMAVSGTSLALFSLEDIAKSAFDIFCVWRDEASGYRFGVKIHVPEQVLDIGTRPYWFVMTDTAPAGTEPDWTQPNDDPSQPYSWPAADGLNISVAPDSQHSSLALLVNIANSGTGA